MYDYVEKFMHIKKHLTHGHKEYENRLRFVFVFFFPAYFLSSIYSIYSSDLTMQRFTKCTVVFLNASYSISRITKFLAMQC